MRDIKPIEELPNRLTGPTTEWLKSLVPHKTLGRQPMEALHIAAASYLSDIFSFGAKILSVHESRSTLSLPDLRLAVALEQDRANACAKLEKDWQESEQGTGECSREEELERAWSAMPASLAARAKKKRRRESDEATYHRRPDGSRRIRKRTCTTPSTRVMENELSDSPDPQSSGASDTRRHKMGPGPLGGRRALSREGT